MELKYVFDEKSNGHNDSVREMISLENGLIASWSSNYPKGVIKIWDVLKNELKFTLIESGPSYGCRPHLLRLSNGYMASCSNGGVEIWDIKNGALKSKINLENPNDKIASMELIDNGRGLATGTDYGDIMLWDIETSALKHTFKYVYEPYGGGEIYTLCSLSDSYLASATSGMWDFRIQIWDLNKYERKYKLSQGRTVTKFIKISDRLFATGDGNNFVKIWNLETGIQVTEYLAGHQSIVQDMILLEDNHLLVSRSGRELIAWDLNTYKIKHTIESNVWLSAMTKLKNGRVATGFSNGSISIWDINVDNAELKYSIENSNCSHAKEISSFLLLENGYLSSGSWDKTIKIWKISDKILN
jgi:WD40 repeat protein